MPEAFKFVVWPRKTVELNGQKVYWYSVIGMVMGDKPISSANELLLMDSVPDNAITDILQNAQRYHPRSHLGDASSALLRLSDQTPQECKPVPKKNLNKDAKPVHYWSDEGDDPDEE